MVETHKKHEQERTPLSEELKGMLEKHPSTLPDGGTPAKLNADKQFLHKKFELLNVSDVNSLKNISQYAGKNTVFVEQGEAVITASGRGVDGIHTQGATTCSIVIAISKDSSDNIKQVGMAHVDAIIKMRSISQFLRRAKEGSEVLEVHVIGGDEDSSLRIIRSCEATHAKIKFLSANLSGRVDSALVDTQGNVYYGEREDLNVSADKEFMKKLGSQRESKLSIKVI